ncbi:MAG: ATP-binding cassette domain-containing protein, partial [Clostridia bacterium]|nr:ATP-binding cassette domain-containing protein [Clostridia bacterium]
IVGGEEKEAKGELSVSFRNVSFHYPATQGRPVLKNVSLDVRKGEMLAIIGATGCGKSSLIYLITRFYDATEGEVLVDGVNVKEHDLEALRGKIVIIKSRRGKVTVGGLTSIRRTISEFYIVYDFTVQEIDWEDFVDGYRRLRDGAPRVLICVHLILGLPGEDDARMLETVRKTAALRPNQVKLHLLHVLRGTRLGEMYLSGEYSPMEREDYIRTVVRALELLPPDTVIGRLTGDGMGEMLLAPDWSRRKVSVINDIDKLMFAENTWQGRLFGGIAPHEGN